MLLCSTAYAKGSEYLADTPLSRKLFMFDAWAVAWKCLADNGTLGMCQSYASRRESSKLFASSALHIQAHQLRGCAAEIAMIGGTETYHVKPFLALSR